ncbi:hypothetical protein B566_EDAN015979 [Ephemera danica]|nr:hypothetical protein B566_EDAN015979 [Ephemera danica]
MSTFISDIFSPQNLQSKRIGPTDITAKDLLPCMKVFVDNLKNAEQKPATLYELTAELHHKTIIQKTVNFYVTEMKAKMPGVADIEKLHNSTKSEAIKQFNEAKKYGDGNITKEFKKILSDALVRVIGISFEIHIALIEGSLAKYGTVVSSDKKLYLEKLNKELNKIETQAANTYRKKLRELIGSKACQNFSAHHKESDASVKREVGKQVAKFKKSGAVKLLIKRLEETIQNIREEYEVQNNELLQVELGKIQREASVYYQNQMQEWLQKSENVCVRKLEARHKEAKTNALELFTNMRSNLGKEFCRRKYNGALRDINNLYTEYEILNKKLRQLYMDDIEIQFNKYIIERTDKLKTELRDGHVKHLNSKLGKIKQEAFKIVSVAEERSEEYIKLQRKAIEKTSRIVKQMVDENMTKKTQSSRKAALRSLSEEIRNLGLGDIWIEDIETKVEMAEKKCLNSFLENAAKNSSNFQFEKNELEKEIGESSKKFILENQRIKKINSEKLNQLMTDCVEHYKLQMKDKMIDIVRVLDNSELEAFHFQAKETATNLYQSKSSETTIPIPSCHQSMLLMVRVKRIIGRQFDEPEVRAFNGNTYHTVVERDGFPRIEVTQNKRKICLKPEEVSAEILKEMKRLAGIHLKHEVHDAVVTIPAYFTEPQRAATLAACKLAEINVLRLFNEPTAAAITYAYQNKSEQQRKIVVFDFGGGTCDVSIVETDGENLVVKASHGDNCLGGQNFDENLMQYLIETHLQDKILKRIDRSRILLACEKAKQKLSENTEYSMLLARIAGSDLSATVSRKKFEEINSDLFSRALQPIEECLKDANLSKSDIDEVVLAGGSSHMPKMQQMLRHFFDDKPLNASINPDEAIAHGAALQAAILTGQCTIKLSIKDITPFSLGIEVKGEKISIIINKRSQIPCKETSQYITTVDNQTEVLISVYQGENVDEADENTKLGKFTLNNVTARKAGETKIDVTFEIDEDGILNVTASEVGMENTNSIVLSKKVN